MLQKHVQEIFDKYNGTLPVKIAEKEGLRKETLYQAYRRGDLEHPKRGVYVLPDALEDEYFSTQSIFTKGVYTGLSALDLHDLSTVLPSKFYLAFPQGYNKKFDEEQIKASILPQKEYSLGIETLESFDGNPVRVYNKERIIVDLLRKKEKLTFEEQEALKEYFEEPGDLERLKKYATFFGVAVELKELVRTYAA